jgi:hypothetical protein
MIKKHGGEMNPATNGLAMASAPAMTVLSRLGADLGASISWASPFQRRCDLVHARGFTDF